MKNMEWRKWISVAGRMVLAYALILASSAFAWQNQDSKEKAASPQKAAAQRTDEKQSTPAAAKPQREEAQGEASAGVAAERKRPVDGSHEGIKVHGHWTIEVRNPDGTLVTHREFENAFAGAGAYPLTTVLAGTNAIGGWLIGLSGGSGAGACPGSGIGLSSSDCVIEQSSNTVTGTGIFRSLTVTTPTNAAGLNTLQLAGTATAGGAGQITIVSTDLNVCPGGGCSPALTGIYVSAGYLFTQASITAVPIASGQTIAVTVIISFS